MLRKWGMTSSCVRVCFVGAVVRKVPSPRHQRKRERSPQNLAAAFALGSIECNHGCGPLSP